MSIWTRTASTEQVPATWGAGVGWSSGEYCPELEKHHPDLPTLKSGMSSESDEEAALCA